MLKLSWRRLLSTLVVPPLLFTLSCSSEPTEVAGGPVEPFEPAIEGIDDEADRVLRQMSEFLAGAAAFRFQADLLVEDVLDTGQKLQFGETVSGIVRRPDRLVVQRSGDVMARTIVYDGTKVSLFDETELVYATVDVPGTIDGMLDYMADQYGVTIPIADFLFSAPYEALVEEGAAGHYVGRHDVAGVACHHIAVSQEAIDWQIWIEAGERPLPRKLVITYKHEVSAPQFIAVLTDWDLSPGVPDDAFVFDPPEGVEQIEFTPFPTAEWQERAQDEGRTQ